MQLEALSESEEDRRPKYTSRHLNRPVVVVSSEVNPWSKTGGLGMVAGSVWMSLPCADIAQWLCRLAMPPIKKLTKLAAPRFG